MTEPEVMEMVNLYAGNGLTSYTIWVSFTFAYLTVAYLVGAKPPVATLKSPTCGRVKIPHPGRQDWVDC